MNISVIATSKDSAYGEDIILREKLLQDYNLDLK